MTDFSLLYERYAPLVRSYALGMCGERALADDITSDAFVRAWTAGGAIRQDTVKAYLFTIARNLYRDSLRRSRGREPLDERIEDERAGPEKQAEDRSDLSFILSAMQTLSESDRAVLLMRAKEDMSYEEIARALDVTVTAAKVRVHRARLKLLNVTHAVEKTRDQAEEL